MKKESKDRFFKRLLEAVKNGSCSVLNQFIMQYKLNKMIKSLRKIEKKYRKTEQLKEAWHGRKGRS